MAVITQPQHFLSPADLLNPETPIQGHGELQFLHTMLEFYPSRLLPVLADKFRYPVFFQLQFRSDWLIAKSSSGQKRLTSLQEFQPKQWRNNEIPTLYTPINSLQILRQKRLTIVVQLYERNKTKQENFAYINVPMKEFVPIEHQNVQSGETGWDYELLVHG